MNRVVGSVMLVVMIFSLINIAYLVSPYVYAEPFIYVNSYWGSVDNPENAYPGSSGVILVIEVVNNNPFKLQSVYGNLSLPSGFTDVNGHGYAVSSGYVVNGSYTRGYVNPGEIFRLRYVLNIDSSVSPGNYLVQMNLTYTFINSSSSGIDSSSYILSGVKLVVSSFPIFTFDIIDIYWSADGETIYPTSPSRDLTLHISIRNLGDYSITSADAALYFNPPFYPSKVEYSVGSIGVGEVFELVFSGIDIDANYPSMTYYEYLVLNYTFTGYGGARKDYSTSFSIPLTIYDPYYPSIQYVSSEWVGGSKIYPGSRDVSLEVTLVNLGRFQLTNLIFRAYLPDGFNNQFGRRVINISVDGLYGFGDFIRLGIDHIYLSENILPGTYYIVLEGLGEGVIGSSRIMIGQNVSIPVVVNDYHTNLSVVGVYWGYGGSPSLALPGSKGITLNLDILYTGEEQVSGLSPYVSLPNGFILKNIEVSQGIISPGSRFTIYLTLDIERDVEPGIYNLSVFLDYIVDPSGQNRRSRIGLNFSLYVSDPSIFRSDLSIVDLYWGISQPISVYPLSQNNPLSITILNKGPYNVEAIYLSLELPSGFSSKLSNKSIVSNLPVGSFASDIYYIDIGDVSPGSYQLNITIYYEVSIYGSVVDYVSIYSYWVVVDNPPATSSYIELLEYGWINDYYVYPGTDEAELVVSFTNLAPFEIDAITINVVGCRYISLPNDVHSIYISGPVRPYGVFTATIPLNISVDASEGYHNISLLVEYLLMSGGDGIRMGESINISIYVHSLEGLVYIGYLWQGESPGPGGSSILNLIYVNNVFESMDGVYVSVHLPEGFTSLINNDSVVNITPYVLSSVTDIDTLLANPSLLLSLPTTEAVSVSRGDYIVLTLPIRIDESVGLGRYLFTSVFHFIDEWGIVRRVELVSELNIFGKTGFVEVDEARSRIILGERVSNVSIVVRNPGSGYFYDVYISIYSVNQLVAFSSAVKHIGVLGPGEEVVLSWRASVNPKTSIYGGIPAIVSIIYTDPIGNRRSVNQTVILYIEGVPRLKLIDISISPHPVYTNSTVSVSATLVNVGDATAKNVEVEVLGEDIVLRGDSYSFLGDIEEGSQIPFTIYFDAGSKIGTISFYIKVRYYNVFNEEETIEYPVTIDVVESPVVEEKGGIIEFLLEDAWRLYSIIVTMVFIVISIFLVIRIYRVSRRGLSEV